VTNNAGRAVVAAGVDTDARSHCIVTRENRATPGAARNLTLSEAVLTNLRTDLLDKPATFEMAELLPLTVSKEILKPAAPAIVGRVSAAMGALLSSARLQPLEPAQDPVQTPVPEKTEDEVAPRPPASRAEHDTKSPSRREPYQSVDVEV